MPAAPVRRDPDRGGAPSGKLRDLPDALAGAAELPLASQDGRPPSRDLELHLGGHILGSVRPHAAGSAALPLQRRATLRVMLQSRTEGATEARKAHWGRPCGQRGVTP